MDRLMRWDTRRTERLKRVEGSHLDGLGVSTAMVCDSPCAALAIANRRSELSMAEVDFATHVAIAYGFKRYAAAMIALLLAGSLRLDHICSKAQAVTRSTALKVTAENSGESGKCEKINRYEGD